MADINNFSQITENFDTIKTLLNSIRAQGILNTSDVDKLLSGINSKLEKLNTEEDIDLIKIFLSELKQNLDERHSVLLSKFGAIESLFSNLLKNSAEALKSSEVKELFDIVATNLSVFSREVVSQKDTLTDIILRLDTMRSDDSLKKDIIKNITVLKNDLEHLNNGFDSIVLSLNENFKTLIKTLSNIDQSEAIGKFEKELSDIIVSSNSILSAIQLLDRKNIQIEDSIKSLATQDDLSSTKKWLSDLAVQQDNLKTAIEALSDKFYKVDNLAEKIDASVNIVAGLKSLISENNDDSSKIILANLEKIEANLKDDVANLDLDVFKDLVKESLKKLLDASISQEASFDNVLNQINTLESSVNKLSSIFNTQEIISLLKDLKNVVIEQLSLNSEKVVQNIENLTNKTISEMLINTQNLEEKFKEVSADVSNLCITNFSEIIDNVNVLKSTLTQLDENYVSGNNAIFSNITDRLALFENSLKLSLEKQEDFVSNSAAKLVEQLGDVKNLSGVLDYKIDASVIEFNNAKKEFSDLKTSVDNILALDFVNVVKDLRVDLYASKQDLSNAIDSFSTDISDKFSNDLFSKYELLISKLDSVEDSFKTIQKTSLIEIKQLLDTVSSALVDILSYVSVQKDFDTSSIDNKLANVIEVVKDNNLNYIEDVRDVVEVIRTQVENNLLQIQQDTSEKIDKINGVVLKSEEKIREEIKYSYNKLLEIQDKFLSLEEQLKNNAGNLVEELNDLKNSSIENRNSFEDKVVSLKTIFMERLNALKNDVSCENADNLSEIKFISENLSQKNIQNSMALKEELKGEILQVLGNLKLNLEELSEELVNSTSKFNVSNNELLNVVKKDLTEYVGVNFEKIVSQIISFEKALNSTNSSINTNFEYISNNLQDMASGLNQSINDFEHNYEKILQDFDVKISDNNLVIKSDIDNLNLNLNNLNSDLSEFANNAKFLFSSLNNGISELSKKISSLSDVNINLDEKSNDIEEGIKTLNLSIDNIKTDLVAENTNLKTSIENVNVNLGGLKSNLLESNKDLNFSISSIKDGIFNLSEKIDASIKDLSLDLLDNGNQQNLSIEKLDSRLELMLESLNNINSDVAVSVDSLKNNLLELQSNIDNNYSLDSKKFDSVESSIALLSENTSKNLTQLLSQILENFVALKTVINTVDEKNSMLLRSAVDDILVEFKNIAQIITNFDSTIDEDITRQMAIIEDRFEVLQNRVISSLDVANKDFASSMKSEFEIINNNLKESLALKFNEYVENFDNLFSNLIEKTSKQSETIDKTVNTLSSTFDEILTKQNQDIEDRITKTSDLLKNILQTNLEVSAADYESLKLQLSELSTNLEKANFDMISDLKAQFDDVIKFVDSGIEIQSQEINNKIGAFQSDVCNINDRFVELRNTSENINVALKNIENVFSEDFNNTKVSIDKVEKFVVENLVLELTNLKEYFKSLTVDISTSATQDIKDEIKVKICESTGLINNDISALISKLDNGVINNISELNLNVNEVLKNIETFNNTFEDDLLAQTEAIKNDMSSIVNSLTMSITNTEQIIDEKFNSLLSTYADLSAGELQSIEAFVNKILKQIDVVKENSNSCVNLIKEFVKQEVASINNEITKESDLIISDIMEQFALFKDFQKDEFTKLTIHLESSVEDYIYNHINDLKSYLDVKTDNSVINHKLDNLKGELVSSSEMMIDNINKLVETNLFVSTISDLKTTNEVLINSMVDTLNKKVQTFIKENVVKDYDEKFAIFDKKFVDIIVDNYEEIKLISSEYNTKIDKLNFNELVEQLNSIKESLNLNFANLEVSINKSINELNKSFLELKEHVQNDSLSKVIKDSLSGQILEIETLVNKQFEYIEDISSLCCENLPELTEMSAIVKYSIINSIQDIITKLNDQSLNVEKELQDFKTDIITQFINIFNQISFVAEQEEIVDYIQEKHSELITILSHIVTNLDTVDDVKDSVALVDNKLENLKEDIGLINEKITSIISADGDIDYVYSLQDLESDIANLRLVLNDIKKSHSSEELQELLKSTSDIYNLVETLKDSFPKLEYEEFKQDFESLTEDIVSISTRTNKLILSSDESHKLLQENLQDFKLVINDLDERTRNFAEEAGINRIDNKLNSINSMITSGAKSTQVFNEVFEYLAEWVDNAGEKINAISNKVESLDDIGQIKIMLEDLKVNAEDNTESVELIEALGNIFDKQVKKISALEAKLDKVIVETTINSKNNKIDMSPMESILNKFLVAMDEKLSSQQDKINNLESKLEEVLSVVDSKDTVQLTKKVGGMDRQIAKLNKSIEKIASHVVEK